MDHPNVLWFGHFYFLFIGFLSYHCSVAVSQAVFWAFNIQSFTVVFCNDRSFFYSIGELFEEKSLFLLKCSTNFCLPSLFLTRSQTFLFFSQLYTQFIIDLNYSQNLLLFLFVEFEEIEFFESFLYTRNLFCEQSPHRKFIFCKLTLKSIVSIALTNNRLWIEREKWF